MKSADDYKKNIHFPQIIKNIWHNCTQELRILKMYPALINCFWLYCMQVLTSISKVQNGFRKFTMKYYVLSRLWLDDRYLIYFAEFNIAARLNCTQKLRIIRISLWKSGSTTRPSSNVKHTHTEGPKANYSHQQPLLLILTWKHRYRLRVCPRQLAEILIPVEQSSSHFHSPSGIKLIKCLTSQGQFLGTPFMTWHQTEV